MNKINDLIDLIDLSLKADKSSEVDVDVKIEVDGQVWTAYSASVSYRDVLFYCDKGVATYLIDSYGDRHVAELFDWEKG